MEKNKHYKNHCDHSFEGDAAEAPVDCVSRDEMA